MLKMADRATVCSKQPNDAITTIWSRLPRFTNPELLLTYISKLQVLLFCVISIERQLSECQRISNITI